MTVGGGYTGSEMMTVAAARALPDGAVVFVGIGLPGAAANLARRLHAPSAVLVYESGCIGAKPRFLPASIGDGVLAEGADAVVGVPEMFSYWLQGGRIDVGLLGAAQIDRFANINTTVIGDYERPRVRLPGAGGAPEIAAGCGEVLVLLRHRRRAFVSELDFITTMGHGRGPGDRESAGLAGRGPAAVITDLGMMRPDERTAELTLVGVHPGVSPEQVRVATGWPLRISPDLGELPPPSPRELAVLRELRAAA